MNSGTPPKKDSGLTASFVTGAIALVFLVIGFQVALFVNKAAVTHIVAHRDHPDTVYVLPEWADGGGSSGADDTPDDPVGEVFVRDEGFARGEGATGGTGQRVGWRAGWRAGSAEQRTGSAERRAGGTGQRAGSAGQRVGSAEQRTGSAEQRAGSAGQRVGSTRRQESGDKQRAGTTGQRAAISGQRTVRRNAQHSASARGVWEKAERKVESFPFNPNTVSVEDLQRLGFSAKQAQSIENYRLKGGRFRRPADFAKSYVVADSIFQRLRPFIRIPRLDINRADSTALLDLPGIGPYFAGKVVQYRERLGGYSCPEQLMEIYHFDADKYDGLKDLITCSAAAPFPIWTATEEQLAQHPHISRAEAHSIILYRQHHSPADCTLDGIIAAGILSPDHASGLARCNLAQAQ